MSFGIPVRNGLAIGLLASTFLSSRGGRGGVASLTLNFIDNNYRALGMNYTFSEIITFTRSSTATFTGSNGLIQTAAINGPRFDYDPVTRAAKGLLIEEQRTNLLTYSAQFDNAAWSKLGASVSANTVTSPDGTVNADNLIEDTSTGLHIVLQTAASTVTLTHTISVYAKSAGRTIIQLQLDAGGAAGGTVTANLTTGVLSGLSGSGSPSATITSAGNGWWRITLTAIPAATGTNVRFLLYLTNGSSSSYTGNGTSGVSLWGAQLEAAAFATSYIPTVASQVTRSADVATMTGTNFSSWYNQSEGTFVTETQLARQAALVGTSVIYVNDGGANNQTSVFYRASGNTGFETFAGGVSQAGLNNGVAITANTTAKIAGAYKANDFAMSTNAGVVQTDSSGTLPTLDRMQIGAGWTNALNGHIRQIAYYNTRLLNSQLQTITT